MRQRIGVGVFVPPSRPAIPPRYGASARRLRIECMPQRGADLGRGYSVTAPPAMVSSVPEV
jgi:hypothetical protein